MTPEDLDRNSTAKKRDLAALVMLILVRFGDAVELFLPGVITQETSCELGVSETEEAVLGIVMFLSLAVSTFLSPQIAGCFSKRTVVLASLYISIIATVICSVVHNYITLLLARLFVGFCVGLNKSNMNVLFTQAVSSAKAADWGIFLANFGFAVGSGWVSVLGFFFLKMLGWRIFLLIVSIPWFIPPILLFHFYLTPAFFKTAIIETNKADETADGAADVTADETANRLGKAGQLSVRQIWRDSVIRARMLKIGGLNFLLMLHGGGTILLLPSLLRAANLSSSTETDRCDGTVGGTQFLIMAGISGGINSLARPLGFYMFKKLPISFRGLMAVLGSLMTISFGVIMVWDFTQPAPNIILISITIGVVVGTWSIMLNEAILCIHDQAIFPTAVTGHSSAVCWGGGCLGAVVGNSIASFMDPVTAVQVNFGLSFIQIALSYCITERISVKEKPGSPREGRYMMMGEVGETGTDKVVQEKPESCSSTSK